MFCSSADTNVQSNKKVDFSNSPGLQGQCGAMQRALDCCKGKLLKKEEELFQCDAMKLNWCKTAGEVVLQSSQG